MNPLRHHPIPAEWLTAYYDGELDPARRAQVESHLPNCPECQLALADLTALSQRLAAYSVPAAARANPAALWPRVQAQLPVRPPAPPSRSPLSASRVLLRWSPGLALLLLNAFFQVMAVAGTVLMFVPARQLGVMNWAGWVYGLAAGSGVGWLTWLLPSGWSEVGLLLSLLTLSGALAVLYVAWLAYELRYGAAARTARILERGS